MSSVLQRVAQELLDCLDMMPRLIESLRERARRCREAAGYVGSLSAGNPILMAAAQHLDAAANACEEALHFAEVAHKRGRGWAAGMVGGGGGGAVGASPGSRPIDTAVPAEKLGPDPHAQALIRERLPVRDGEKGKTRGLWYGRSGKESPLVSGYDHYQELADDFTADRLKLGPMGNATHVEIKFAMFMRERRLSNETIYINNEPCKGPASCPRWIESFLPPGARLTIHWPGGPPKTFEGKADP